VSVTNLDPDAPARVELDLRGRAVTSVAGRVLASDDVADHNTFDAPTAVEPRDFHGFEAWGSGLTVHLPPGAFVVLELGLAD